MSLEGRVCDAVAQRWGLPPGSLAEPRAAIEIHEMLYSLFRDPAVEREWLREPREALGGATPLSRIVAGKLDEVGSLLHDICGR
jgi:hypothetical protein